MNIVTIRPYYAFAALYPAEPPNCRDGSVAGQFSEFKGISRRRVDRQLGGVAFMINKMCQAETGKLDKSQEI
jgi:hypothetical protein